MSKPFTATIGLCIAAALTLSGCNPDPNALRIIARIHSPEGTQDAVYAEDQSGDATVGPSEQVYVVAKGRFPRLQDRIFNEERVCDLRVRWLNNHAIEIGYAAETPKVENVSQGSGVEVQAKWTGRDVSNGC